MKRQTWGWSASMMAVIAVAGVAATAGVGQMRNEETVRRDRDAVAKITRKMSRYAWGGSWSICRMKHECN